MAKIRAVVLLIQLLQRSVSLRMDEETTHQHFESNNTRNGVKYINTGNGYKNVSSFVDSSHLDLHSANVPAPKKKKKKRYIGLGKANKALSKMKGIVSEWSFSKTEAKRLFDKYYECQAAKVESLLREEFPIRAVLAVEGDKVRLTCQICYRPDVDAASQRGVWQFLRHEDTGLVQITESKHLTIEQDYSLLIKSVDVTDAGQYFCLEHHDYAAVWQLDVFLTDKRRFVKLGKDSQRPETFLWDRNLRLFTKWGTWSECNTCDRLGQRSRTGQCTVKKIYTDIPIFPRDFPLMSLYPGGVPCHSTALPRHLRQLPSIGERKSETLVSPCNVPCPTEPPTRVITDESGDVLEVLKPGFYSLNEKPELPKPVIRKVIYEPEQSHLVLKCPGDVNKDLIRWQRGERYVEPLAIQRQTQGRVQLDQERRLHLDPLLLTDTAVYHCWEKSRRVASIKLMVVDEVAQELKLYISYAGLTITVLGTVVLFISMCCKKKDKEAR